MWWKYVGRIEKINCRFYWQNAQRFLMKVTNMAIVKKETKLQTRTENLKILSLFHEMILVRPNECWKPPDSCTTTGTGCSNIIICTNSNITYYCDAFIKLDFISELWLLYKYLQFTSLKFRKAFDVGLII